MFYTLYMVCSAYIIGENQSEPQIELTVIS